MKSSKEKGLFVIMAAVLLVTLACGTTDLSTLLNEVITEIPAISDDATTPSAWYLDEFDTNLDHWSEFYMTEATDNEYEEEAEAHLSDGGLWFDINLIDTYIYLFNNLYEYDNVSIAAETKNTGVGASYIALVCRYDSALGWYEFDISTTGDVTILRYSIADENFTTIAEGTSDAINQGNATNTFLGTCSGNELSLTINGEAWDTITDDTFSSGLIGVSAGSMDNLPVQVIFNWMEITQP